MNIQWMQTESFLVVSMDNLRPCVIDKQSKLFEQTMELIRNMDKEGVQKLLFKGHGIDQYTKGAVKVDTLGRVKNGSENVDDALVMLINKFKANHQPYQPLLKFMQNVKLNPSEESRKHLFLFLQKHHVPLTKDGHFIGYKKVTTVNGHLYDSYSKKICNDVGKTVSMDRALVDPNRNAACSTGLHVGTYSYVTSFTGDTQLIVKVNPKDVVSVPSDYNDQKIRVCQYTVLARSNTEIKDLYIPWTKSQAQTEMRERDIKEGKIETLSGREIISFIKKKYGVRISLSPKSKKSIIKMAKKIMNEK